MATNLLPALTGQGRIFINPGGPGCNNRFQFHNCMKLDSVDKSFGDVTPIYCPDPRTYDQFIEVAVIKGADSRWTSSLIGRLPLTQTSPLEELSQLSCAFDMQVHYGRCTRPDDFDNFDSAIILQDVRLTSYGLSTLTALTPDERAVIEETVALSIGNVYRIFQPTISQVDQTVSQQGTATLWGVVNADSKSCGDDNCNPRSNGCELWIGVQQNANNTINLTRSNDGGVTWSTNFLFTADTTNGDVTMTGVAIDGNTLYLAFRTATQTVLYRVSVTDIFNGVSSAVRIYTDTNLRVRDIAITTNYIYLVGSTNGASSRVVAVDKSTLIGYTLDAGTIHPGGELLAVDVLDDDTVIVAGANSVYGVSTTFGSFTPRITTFLGQTIHDVKMFNNNNWLFATDTGIYCTGNAGATWTQVDAVAGTPKMDFYDNIVGYYQDNTGIYRTIDSGNTWTRIRAITRADQQSFTVCPYNPNFFMAAGGSAFNTSGYILIGRPA